MLSSLRVENIAIAEAAELRLGRGFNAMTGETGAGKSVLVAALELALGGRARADAVRSGARMGVVEAAFDPPHAPPAVKFITKRLELEWTADESLTMRREISAQGRSRCFIAGQLVNVNDLKDLGELLVDLHGQHEHQSLFHLPLQRAALDAYGGYDPVLNAYREAYVRFTELRERKERLEKEAQDFEKRLDFLNFQLSELEEAAPAEDESEALETEEARLAHAEALSSAARRSYALLYENEGDEQSVLAALKEVERALGQVSDHDPLLGEFGGKAGEIQALVEDLALTLRDYAERCESDPARLEEIGNRLALLQKLRRKHGARDDAQLAEMLAAMRDERDRMIRDDRERGEIASAVSAAEKELAAGAQALSEARCEAARKLSRSVVKTLAQVGMEKAKFDIEVSPADEFSPDGRDRVEFFLAANVGEGRHPLREVASGGELSRTMLAIKGALAERDSIPTLVFDEIDAGISGETAARVGAVMEKLAGSHQIVCITHHAAIAARAAHHASVRKDARSGRTVMEVIQLTKAQRVEELARLMGGDAHSEAGKRLARQLMSSAS